MATKTIPARFPTLKRKDCGTYRPARAGIIRSLAQAQNYIYANSRRIYANHAYEGNGNTLRHGEPDNILETVPGAGTANALPVASFAVPPNWGPSNQLRVQGTVSVNVEGARVGTAVIFTVHELDGTFTGQWAQSAVDYETAVETINDQFDLTMSMPQDRVVQVRVWITADTTQNGEYFKLNCISAAYKKGTSAELGGEDETPWNGLPTVGSADTPLSSALLYSLVRNTLALYARNPWEVCQSWLGTVYGNTSTFVEVGRYYVRTNEMPTSFQMRLIVHCTHGGAGNEVRVQENGADTVTFTALTTGTQELTVNFTPTGADEDVYYTVEARSTAAAADWGTTVLGVYLYESDVTPPYPSGVAAPSTYEPIDEEQIEADDFIAAEDIGSDRAGIQYLIANDAWLAQHRTARWLIGDWRHRVYKRFSYQSGNLYIASEFDWTPGPIIEYGLGRPKNITIRGDNTTLNGDDGFGGYPYGLEETAPAFSSSWDNVQDWEEHGRRVGHFKVIVPTGHNPVSQASNAHLLVYLRGRRLPPFLLKTFANQDEGPLASAEQYHNRAFFIYEYPTSDFREIKILEQNALDFTPKWFGPSRGLHVFAGVSSIDINGRCPQHSKYYHIDSGTGLPTSKDEGLDGFEVELQSALIMDDKLTDAALFLL